MKKDLLLLRRQSHMDRTRYSYSHASTIQWSKVPWQILMYTTMTQSIWGYAVATYFFLPNLVF